MKWMSVRKFRLPASSIDNVLVRIFSSASSHYRLQVLHYSDNYWVDTEDLEPIEDEFHMVTHFCIPDPLEIEE